MKSIKKNPEKLSQIEGTAKNCSRYRNRLEITLPIFQQINFY